MTKPNRRRRNKRDAWRIAAYYGNCRKPQTRRCDEEHTSGFDELVIGDWFHIERMDTGYWWLRMGEREADISVDANGRAKVVWRDEA